MSGARPTLSKHKERKVGQTSKQRKEHRKQISLQKSIIKNAAADFKLTSEDTSLTKDHVSQLCAMMSLINDLYPQGISKIPEGDEAQDSTAADEAHRNPLPAAEILATSYHDEESQEESEPTPPSSGFNTEEDGPEGHYDNEGDEVEACVFDDNESKLTGNRTEEDKLLQQRQSISSSTADVLNQLRGKAITQQRSPVIVHAQQASRALGDENPQQAGQVPTHQQESKVNGPTKGSLLSLRQKPSIPTPGTVGNVVNVTVPPQPAVNQLTKRSF